MGRIEPLDRILVAVALKYAETVVAPGCRAWRG